MQRVIVAGATGYLGGFVAREFNRHQGELLAFFTTMATTDVVAPSTGTHTLEAHFQELGVES
jgi:short subunit dehydrogenase-like uncharacterized protein